MKYYVKYPDKNIMYTNLKRRTDETERIDLQL